MNLFKQLTEAIVLQVKENGDVKENRRRMTLFDYRLHNAIKVNRMNDYIGWKGVYFTPIIYLQKVLRAIDCFPVEFIAQYNTYNVQNHRIIRDPLKLKEFQFPLKM